MSVTPPTPTHPPEEQSSSGDVPFLHSHLAHDTFKKARLQSTFDLVAQMLIVAFVGLLVYYNGLMLLPHVTPIFWAILWAIFLHRPLVLIKRGLEWVDHRTNDIKLKIYLTTATLYILVTLTSSLLTIVIATVIFSIWSFLIFGDRSSVAALILLALLSVLLSLPTYWLIVTCVEESQAIATKIQTFVRENPEFTNLLNDFGSSPYYRWIHSYAAQWGVEVPPFDAVQIKEKIVEFSLQFTSHFTDALGSIVYFLSDGLRFFVSFITFASTLFYLLVNMSELNRVLSDVSPFSDEDSHLLMKSLNKSVTSVFMSSFAVGLSHLVGTYLVFKLCGVDLSLVLSFIAGFTSVLPVIGSWIVWVPIAIGKLLVGETLHSVAIITVQILLQGPVDTLIYSFIPGNAFLVGFALAMGVWVFGPIGVVVGPLLAGLTVTVGDIYRTYQRLPRLKIKKGLSANEIPVDLDSLDQVSSSSPSLSKHLSTPHLITYPSSNTTSPTQRTATSPALFHTAPPSPPSPHRHTLHTASPPVTTPLVVPPTSRRESQVVVLPPEKVAAVVAATTTPPSQPRRPSIHRPPEIAPLPPASPIRIVSGDQPPAELVASRHVRSSSISRNNPPSSTLNLVIDTGSKSNSNDNSNGTGTGDNDDNDEIETVILPPSPSSSSQLSRSSLSFSKPQTNTLHKGGNDQYDNETVGSVSLSPLPE